MQGRKDKEIKSKSNREKGGQSENKSGKLANERIDSFSRFIQVMGLGYTLLISALSIVLLFILVDALGMQYVHRCFGITCTISIVALMLVYIIRYIRKNRRNELQLTRLTLVKKIVYIILILTCCMVLVMVLSGIKVLIAYKNI